MYSIMFFSPMDSYSLHVPPSHERQQVSVTCSDLSTCTASGQRFAPEFGLAHIALMQCCGINYTFLRSLRDRVWHLWRGLLRVPDCEFRARGLFLRPFPSTARTVHSACRDSPDRRASSIALEWGISRVPERIATTSTQSHASFSVSRRSTQKRGRLAASVDCAGC